MSDNSVKIYSQYDYDGDMAYSEARIKIPCENGIFLITPRNYSTFEMTFSGYGDTAEAATNNLIKKLEDNASALQAIAAKLKDKNVNVRDGYKFDGVSVSDIDVDKMKKLIK